MQIYTKDGIQLNVDVVTERDHFNVEVDGAFWCSCDNLREIGEEINLLIQTPKEDIMTRICDIKRSYK